MKVRSRIVTAVAFLVVVAVGVALFATGVIGGNPSTPSALSGGSPYPMSQLMAV